MILVREGDGLGGRVTVIHKHNFHLNSLPPYSMAAPQSYPVATTRFCSARCLPCRILILRRAFRSTKRHQCYATHGYLSLPNAFRRPKSSLNLLSSHAHAINAGVVWRAPVLHDPDGDHLGRQTNTLSPNAQVVTPNVVG